MIIETLIKEFAPAIRSLIGDKEVADKLAHELALKSMSLQAKELELASQERIAQAEVNKAEAASGNKWASGWRPSIGYTCAAALAFNTLGLPIIDAIAQFQGVEFEPPRIAMDQIEYLILGMLGMGGMRSWDKRNGKA